MADKLKELPAKILEWWNKFTSKQKTIIIAITAAVIFTFVILVYVISKPQYTKIGTYASTAESAEIVEILDDAGIEHRETADALTIEVRSEQLYQANLALGASGIVSDRLKYSDFVQGGMSATTSDKEKQYRLYVQAEMEKTFEAIETVKDAIVIVNIPPQNGTLGAQQEESSAFIQLELDGNFSSANAAGVAKAAATALGNATTANITILDFDGNTLFVGGDDYSNAGIASSMQELKNQAESMVANQVKRVLYGTKQYNLIEVTSHLDMDYSNYEETVKEYYANPDRTEGMLAERDQYEAENSNGIEGVPGTDTNDGNDLTGYVNPDYNGSESSQTEISEKFLPNESSNYKITPAGGINYGASSMAIAMITYKEYYEESVERQGLLDGTTWEEFKDANGQDIKREVDPEYYHMAAMATGIDQESISIIAYESPIFYDKEGLGVSSTDLVSIIMIVLILALLGFVVLRSMRSRKGEPEEEELSVESMLQSTPESTLEDIDVENKSETRRLIEKFVDENPESAANLLRNWLNDDWDTPKRGAKDDGISGTQKAAILLIALGPERSAGIFKHLKEEEIEELTLEIANTRSVTPQVKEDVINEFYEVCLAQQYIAEGGITYAKDLLEKALGSEKAMDVIGKLTASLQVKPFEFVRKTDASQLINFIQDEHPQTIALILSYLAAGQAATIISALPPERQADVARRIAVMDRTSPDVIKEVEKVLESKLASLVNQDYTIIGGVDAVVEILNTVDRGTERHIMETLEIEEPELADEIRKKMFVFEDILLLDDKAIQRVLRDVDNNDLGIALKSSNDQVKAAIFNNLSKRLAVMIQEDMEFMGPVRMKDVEEAQQKIVNIIRKLEDSGEIIISRGGGDEIVV